MSTADDVTNGMPSTPAAFLPDAVNLPLGRCAQISSPALLNLPSDLVVRAAAESGSIDSSVSDNQGRHADSSPQPLPLEENILHLPWFTKEPNPMSMTIAAMDDLCRRMLLQGPSTTSNTAKSA